MQIMKNLDETIAYENALDSYFSMLCSASRQHLFNKSKSINEIMFNNKIETDFDFNLFCDDTDYESVYESKLKYTSTKALNNHIDLNNKSNDNLKEKKIRRGIKKARKQRKIFLKKIINHLNKNKFTRKE